MADKEEIEKFITDIRSQENPREAGLYDLIEKPDGMLENCYVYGVVLGTFAEEPNLYIKMQITSYNDLAYSIDFGDYDYVLPKEWLERLEKN